MAETRFIKTVEYGGYDRADVLKRFEFLNSQVYELRNELRETKLLIEEYKKGTDEEKAHENVMAGERMKLTNMQVQSETMGAKLKAAEEDVRNMNSELEKLREENAQMKKDLDEARTKITALEASDSAAALSAVFIGAQNTAKALVDEAEEKAAQREETLKTLAAETIEDANSTAAEIIYEAEKKAAEKEAESKNQAEEMKVASNNLRVAMLDEVEGLSEEITKIRDMLLDFEQNGMAKIMESEKLLTSTGNKLKSGGVPTFRMPEHYEAELPEAPEGRKPFEEKKTSEEKKKTNAKLEELQKMANSMGGDKSKAAEAKDSGNEKKAPSGEKKKGVDLAALAAQAAALGGKKK